MPESEWFDRKMVAIDKDLHAQIAAIAKELRMPIRNLVDEYLRKGLGRKASKR